MSKMDEQISQAAAILSRSASAGALCGAGVSAESGVATFRDAGGLWERLDPAEVATTERLIHTLETNPGRLIEVFFELLDAFEKAEPNAGHVALGRMEQMGVLKTVITQNIDDLHREGGSQNIIEVHGNVFRTRCLGCGSKVNNDRRALIREIRDKLNAMQEYSLSSLISLARTCQKCGSPMRPDVVMFGESVQQLPEAYRAAQDSDVMLVLGTSGVVYPAAELPLVARKAGATLIEINPGENSFARGADIYLPMKTGDALPAIVEHLSG